MVAGATAEVALEAFSHPCFIKATGVLGNEGGSGHDHARGAVAALEAVALLECGLDRVPVVTARRCPE